MIPSAYNAIDVAALVRRAGLAYPHKTAIVWEQGTRTYAELLAKFHDNAAHGGFAAQADKIAKAVLHLEDLPDGAALAPLLAQQGN